MSIKLWLEETDMSAERTCRDWAARFADDDDANSSYEHGVRVPDVEVLNKLADVFGVTVDFLLGRSTGDKDREFIEALQRGEYAVSAVEREIIRILRNFPKEKMQTLLEFGRFLLVQGDTGDVHEQAM